jgi:hypothetical protein
VANEPPRPKPGRAIVPAIAKASPKLLKGDGTMLRNSASERRLTLVSLGVLLALAILTGTVRPRAAQANEEGAFK